MSTRRHTLSLLVLLSLLQTLPQRAPGQGSAGTKSNVEPRYLVDIPTAGMLSKGSYALDVDFYQEGGVLMGFTVGIFNRLSLGLSYGGSRLIGSDEPSLNQLPGVNVKIRLLEENIMLPALAIGFDTQGRDGYLKDLRRYVIKSPGFYAALSKNYSLLGFFSIHGGVNYSLERADGDKDINVFAGVEKTVGPVISIVAEYNLGVNDSHGEALGKGRGYLNGGIRWSLGSGLTLGVNLKDLIKNGRDVTVANRTVRLEYVKFW